MTEIANVRARTLGGAQANQFVAQRAFIDVRGGPVALTLPAFGDRYASVAFMDMYSNNVAVLGVRTTGTQSATFTLVVPTDAAPADAIRFPTPWVWALARVVVDGPADVPAAPAVLGGIRCKASTSTDGGAPAPIGTLRGRLGCAPPTRF